jgi:hypothetical protein
MVYPLPRFPSDVSMSLWTLTHNSQAQAMPALPAASAERAKSAIFEIYPRMSNQSGLQFAIAGEFVPAKGQTVNGLRVSRLTSKF